MSVSAASLVAWVFVSSISIPNASGQGNGAVTLFRNGVSSISYSSGIVRVYYNSEWGNICYDYSFGYTEATVVCQQLRYTGVSSYSYSGIEGSYGTDYSSILLDDVYCSSSSYLTILQCSYSTFISSTCEENYDDVTVTCYTTRIWDNPYSGQIRLNGSTHVTQGLVEVYCNGKWGTICDDSFSFNAGDTICIQLGYNDHITYDSGIYEGNSDQPIWLTDVYCSNDYSCLSSCTSCPSSEVTICGHYEDVTIYCQYLTSSSEFGSTLNTCDYGYVPTDASADDDIVGLIVGITVTIFVIIVALSIGIPIFICCCIGVGVGAAVNSSNRSRTTVTTSTVVGAQATAPGTTTAFSSNIYSPQPAQFYTQPYAQPAAGYAAQPTGYPAQPTGYPAQPTGYPAAYPTQPAMQTWNESKPPPYPDQGQGGYPMEGYPP